MAGLGAVCAMVASTAFTLNDVGVKFLSGDYALHQIVLIRATVGMLITLAIIMPLEGGYGLIRTNRIGLHLLRGVFVVAANLLFFLGLAEIPLSEATAIFFVAPLIITIFSSVFLAEKVGPWRWFAVAVGLLGTLVILRPTSSSFQIAGLLPLASAFCYAGLHVLTRKMGSTEKASTLSFYIQISFIFTAALMGLAFGNGSFSNQDSAALKFLLRPWIIPTPIEMTIMAGVGLASAIGGYFISQAYRLSEAALIAPIEYLGLVLAVFWGIAIFDEWPDNIAWIGMILILGGGILMIWRETVSNKKKARPRPLPRN